IGGYASGLDVRGAASHKKGDLTERHSLSANRAAEPQKIISRGNQFMGCGKEEFWQRKHKDD
ncbi:MAG TPA: hypothetical protein VN920_17120, partial [Pyrinomonadaceae bacterium]|nr:hypothetical protein [Pyrinomonadaceae bacterium]